MNEGRGGNWNRAARRSGGDRPIVATGALSEAQIEEMDRRDLALAAEAGAPLALLVVTFLHLYGVDWATAALRRCNRLPKPARDDRSGIATDASHPITGED
jgi:hypothetical protein